MQPHRTVLIVPGGPGLSPSYLRPYTDHIFRDFRRIYVNHAAASHAGEVLARAQEKAVQANLTDRDVIFTHSWGSWIALELCQRLPLPARFVLANPVPLTGEGLTIIQRRLLDRVTPWQHARLGQTTDGNRIMQILLRSYCGHRGRLPHLSFRYNPRKGARIESETGVYDHRPVFATIAARTRLIFGKTDYIRPTDFPRTAARHSLLPKGHFGFAEATDSYRKAVLSFLDGDDVL